METARFEQLVVEVIEDLPHEFKRYLDQVEVVVMRRPLAEHRRVLGIKPWQTVYGMYEGVPLTERVSSDLPLLPDTIILFQEPLERDFRHAELPFQIRRTVLHEIAHLFGISDERLEELGVY